MDRYSTTTKSEKYAKSVQNAPRFQNPRSGPARRAGPYDRRRGGHLASVAGEVEIDARTIDLTTRQPLLFRLTCFCR